MKYLYKILLASMTVCLSTTLFSLSFLYAKGRTQKKTLETINVKNNETLEIAYNDNRKDTLEISPPLKSGEERTVKYSSNDGDLTFNIKGENENIPLLLINEFITKGKPDKIEFYIKEEGNLNGTTIMYGKGDNVNSYTFGTREVHKGEFVVVELEEGLSANNGFIEVYSTSSPFGRLIDKVVYTNKNEEVNTEGWSGYGIDSTGSTTTRSINRKSENGIPIDTDTSDDWYVTKTKGASWGETNCKEIYVKV